MRKPRSSETLCECGLLGVFVPEASFFFFSLLKFNFLSNQYPDNVIGPGSQYDNAYFEFKYVRVYGNGNSTVIGGTSTSTAVASSTKTASHSSSAGVGNTESLWLVSWMWAVAAVMGAILYRLKGDF